MLQREMRSLMYVKNLESLQRMLKLVNTIGKRTQKSKEHRQMFPKFNPPSSPSFPSSSDAPAVFRTKSVRGGLLPNPRLLSLLLRHTPEGHKQPVNALFVQIGQLVDHDFGITTVFGSEWKEHT